MAKQKAEMTLQDAVDIIISTVVTAQEWHENNFAFEMVGDALIITISPVKVDDEKGTVTVEEGEP